MLSLSLANKTSLSLSLWQTIPLSLSLANNTSLSLSLSGACVRVYVCVCARASVRCHFDQQFVSTFSSFF